MDKVKNKLFLTPRARLSFPSLFEARASIAGQKPKFSATLIFDLEAQKTPEWQALKAAEVAAIHEEWGSKKPAGLKSPFRKAEEKQNDDGTFKLGFAAGFAFMNVTAQEKFPPKVVLRNGKDATEKDVYGGCYVRAQLTAFAYDTNGNRGVSFGLRGVQKLEDGEAFGGSGPVKFEALEPLPGEAAAEAMGVDLRDF